MTSYIGAETIVSPLGLNIASTWQAIVENQCGIKLYGNAGFNSSDVHLAKIELDGKPKMFNELLIRCLTDLKDRVDEGILESDKTLLIISSTKGEINHAINNPFGDTFHVITNSFDLKNDPIIISNACISGVLAINTASGYLNIGKYDHVVVVGCDVISEFVLYGFQSLYAISEKPCLPFDEARNGITLGEGVAAVLISKNREVFKQLPQQLLAGACANDANHISGPSRTGEGLVRTISRTLTMHHIKAENIDYVNAHGTATRFNDEMESIAFQRVGLDAKPINSLKGYFGHTLGAAGVLETVLAMQMMRNSLLIKSLGYNSPGTTNPLNIITENKAMEINCFLKTASGFGGGNAALMVRKL